MSTTPPPTSPSRKKMGRTRGSRNQPGHNAGGARAGAGRKRKHSLPEGAEPAKKQHKAPKPDTPPNGSQNGDLAFEDPEPAEPSIRLCDIHPDLIPFLNVPHHVPLVCFFDPNRYPPLAQHMGGIPLPPPPQQLGSPMVPEDIMPAADHQPSPPAEDPPSPLDELADADGDFEQDEEQMEDDDQDVEQMMEGSVQAETEAEVDEAPVAGPSGSSTYTGPFTFSTPISDGKRKRRRCLICMNAGRINHAFICPGRGNRAVCATAREIEKHGGTLPAESSKWNSKNTQTPIFTPVPTPLFPLLPPHHTLPPLPPGITISIPQPGGTVYTFPNNANGNLLPPVVLPPPPPTSLQTPTADAPLGLLADGTARQRRARRCKICTAKGLEATNCVGRSAQTKCPYYSEVMAATRANMAVMRMETGGSALGA